MQALMSTGRGRSMWASGPNTALYAGHFFRAMRPLIRQIAQDCLDACRGADIAFGSVLDYWVAFSAAEKLRLPLHALYLQPVHPNGLYPTKTVLLEP